MSSKKILILLPDGVGLRNFSFSNFVEIGEQLGWEVIFWNQTPFDLSSLGLKEIKLQVKPRPFTDLIKRAKINSELSHFENKWNDSVYSSYKFSPSSRGIKARLKNTIVSILESRSKNENGLKQLRNRLKKSERSSKFYDHCKVVLKREKPDIVFCTSQRPVTAIAPLTAAQDLNIPTASFIFSWDNLSKATLVVEADHYFVWSKYMVDELVKYYPYINTNNIHITGTPQFEAHYNASLLISKEVFFEQHNLDLKKKYICFSGDDITTSPDDPQYLEDLAKAVQTLNAEGLHLGIIFRRCPVDFSGRYQAVIDTYPEIIKEISPLWEKQGDSWNTILPTKEDLALQVNTVHYSSVLINLGSTMVFDAVTHKKPCFYINYDVENKKVEDWSTENIYKYVHFRSMPSSKSVIWINSKNEIANKIASLLNNDDEDVIRNAKTWFNLINESPADKASERIWKCLEKIKTNN
ncbi:UDP-glycosyltransferase [Gillisia sp. Hel_I_29]|uniref:UDP-glycosyltransferase n=1 Tax=Gillisia sp. Hel_I_29 TaxID=1249975 RepID=UPI0005504BF3|nr:UDP-glycosyltransferase [Gillisia sp. Hel_I_29]